MNKDLLEGQSLLRQFGTEVDLMQRNALRESLSRLNVPTFHYNAKANLSRTRRSGKSNLEADRRPAKAIRYSETDQRRISEQFSSFRHVDTRTTTFRNRVSTAGRNHRHTHGFEISTHIDETNADAGSNDVSYENFAEKKREKLLRHS